MPRLRSCAGSHLRHTYVHVDSRTSRLRSCCIKPAALLSCLLASYLCGLKIPAFHDQLRPPPMKRSLLLPCAALCCCQYYKSQHHPRGTSCVLHHCCSQKARPDRVPPSSGVTPSSRTVSHVLRSWMEEWGLFPDGWIVIKCTSQRNWVREGRV